MFFEFVFNTIYTGEVDLWVGLLAGDLEIQSARLNFVILLKNEAICENTHPIKVSFVKKFDVW